MSPSDKVGSTGSCFDYNSLMRVQQNTIAAQWCFMYQLFTL